MDFGSQKDIESHVKEFEKKRLMKVKGFSLSGFDASKSELNEMTKKCEKYCSRRYGSGMELKNNEIVDVLDKRYFGTSTAV